MPPPNCHCIDVVVAVRLGNGLTLTATMYLPLCCCTLTQDVIDRPICSLVLLSSVGLLELVRYPGLGVGKPWLLLIVLANQRTLSIQLAVLDCMLTHSAEELIVPTVRGELMFTKCFQCRLGVALNDVHHLDALPSTTLRGI